MGEAPPFGRNGPRLVEDVAADGLIFGALRNLDADLIFDIEDAHLGVDDPSAAWKGEEGGPFDVVLVFDLADELFEDVFDGDDPFGSPILVDDDGHVELLGPKFLEKEGDFFIFGGVEDGFGEGLDGGVEVGLGLGDHAEEVFIEDDADDFIEGFPIEGHAAVPFVGKGLDCLADGDFCGEAKEVDAGDHDLFGDA